MAFIVVDEHQQIEALFRRLGSEVAYVNVRRILDRKTYKPLGRRDFNAIDLAGWLESDDGPLEMDEEKARKAEQGRLIEAAMLWLQSTIEEDIGDRAMESYQIQWWRAKGMGCLGQLRVTARNQDAEERDDERDEDGGEDGEERAGSALPDIVTMPLPEPIKLPEVPANAWESFARSSQSLQSVWERQVTHGQHIATHTFSLLERAMHVSNAELRTQLRNANAEIARLQRHMSEVTGQLVQLRIGSAELGQSTVATTDELKIKESMARTFIEQLGSLGRLALSSKLGIDPALVSLLDKIMADDKLVAMLRDPEVQEMFAEPGATEGLGAFLSMALENHRAAKAQKKAEADAAAAPNP